MQNEETRPKRAKAPARPPRVGAKVGARWTRRIASRGFAPIAQVFLSAYAQKPLGLSTTEAMLVIQLISFKWTAEAPFPRVRVLAQRLGVTTRAVSMQLKRLEERGFVARIHRDRRYRFDMTGLFKALENWMENNSPGNDVKQVAA